MFHVFSPVQERLYGLLSQERWVNADELSKHTGLSHDAVIDVMSSLQSNGFVWLHRGPFNQYGQDEWKWKLRTRTR